jgi:hypothetical protein
VAQCGTGWAALAKHPTLHAIHSRHLSRILRSERVTQLLSVAASISPVRCNLLAQGQCDCCRLLLVLCCCCMRSVVGCKQQPEGHKRASECLGISTRTSGSVQDLRKRSTGAVLVWACMCWAVDTVHAGAAGEGQPCPQGWAEEET